MAGLCIDHESRDGNERMSTNPNYHDQLRQLVERAVRPVRAGTMRKLAMREELYAHVSHIFDEEHDRLGDPHLAVVEVTRRFGSANNLSSELQASVPWFDAKVAAPLQYLIAKLGPTTVLGVTLTCWLALLGFMAIFRAVVSEPLAVGIELFTVLALHFGIYLGFFSIAGASHGVLGHKRSRSWAFLYAAAFCLFITCGGIFLIPDGPPLLLASYAVVLTLAFYIISYAFAAQMRQKESRRSDLQAWGSLELESM